MIVPCPICEHATTCTLVTVKDRDLMICKECRHVFWRKMPSESELSSYYSTKYTTAYNQITTQNDNASYYCGHVDELAAFAVLPKEKLRIADIGCSYPIFLEQARSAGAELCIGVDWSLEAKDYGLSRGILMLTPDEFMERVPDGTINVLRYSHTLEHVIDPVGVLSLHLQKLAFGGVLYITQPNIPVLQFSSSTA